MNYRHAFHAGNHADVLKHMALMFCLGHLKRKATPFAVLDTHAGMGLYDLRSEQAQRSPEWVGGVGKLWDWPNAPMLVTLLMDVVRAFNKSGELDLYPGSPALVAAALRGHDTLAACERHPEEAEALRQRLARIDNVHIHERDGWEALTALLPPAQKRGLVLIDPPYEEPDELARAARALGPALQRFGHGMYLWWRPLKSDSALDRADAEAREQMSAAGLKPTLRADLWIDTPRPDGKLMGSSIFLINPPFGLEQALRDALPTLAERLSAGAHGWRLWSNVN